MSQPKALKAYWANKNSQKSSSFTLTNKKKGEGFSVKKRCMLCGSTKPTKPFKYNAHIPSCKRCGN